MSGIKGGGGGGGGGGERSGAVTNGVSLSGGQAGA